MEDYVRTKEDEPDWEIDDHHIEHLKELGLYEEDDNRRRVISRLRTIYYMQKPKGKFSTWKKKKPLERKVADELVKTHERNEKLQEKNIKLLS